MTWKIWPLRCANCSPRARGPTDLYKNAFAIVDQQIADHKERYERLLDLYLGGQYPREMRIGRKVCLEKTIASLKEERERLAESLAASEITNEDIVSIQEFARAIAKGLKYLTFEEKCRVVDLLELHGTLTVEDGQNVVFAQCVLGKETLNIASIPTKEYNWHEEFLPTSAGARLRCK